MLVSWSSSIVIDCEVTTGASLTGITVKIKVSESSPPFPSVTITLTLILPLKSWSGVINKIFWLIEKVAFAEMLAE